jgi:hypothetical protein
MKHTDWRYLIDLRAARTDMARRVVDFREVAAFLAAWREKR